MKKLLIIAALAAIATGCATKSRSIDIEGMFISESGQLAIGHGRVDAVPEATESAIIHYEEDVAMLKPSQKLHDIDIILTGTNAVNSAEGIVKAICGAFVKVAPSVAKADNEAKGQLGSDSVGVGSDASTQKSENCVEDSDEPPATAEDATTAEIENGTW